MVFNSQKRAQVKEVERHWISNLVIRLIIFALDLTACIIFICIPLPGRYLWCAYVGLVPSGIWTLVVIIFRLCRVAPIHPGVHVGCELTLWLTFCCVQVFAYLQVSSAAPWWAMWYGRSGDWPDGEEWAASLFACLSMSILTILHFYLFIRACISTSRARSHEIATQAAAIAAQMMKDMEDRGTFYRRNSGSSYGYRPSEIDEEAGGHIIGLENLHHDTGLAPLQSSRLSHVSHARTARTGRTRFSEARTQYSHTRSMSVPVPTSPMSLRTARTDEPSLFRMER